MNCEICNQPFNLTSKLPLVLYCCGGTTCKECIINLAGGPQQRLFTCPHKDCQEENQDQNTLKPNKHLEKVLKSAIGILCDQHPQNYGEFYCLEDQQLVCAACLVSTHRGHKCQSVDKKDIIKYNANIMELLKKELERIQKLISDIEQYQSNEKQLTSIRYLELIKEAQNIVNPRLSQQDKNSLQFPPFEIQKEKEQPQQIQQIKEMLNLDSKLIKQNDYELLKLFLNTDKLALELLYRGTQHGFKRKTFHYRCDNNGPTLTVVKSEHNQVFGGYTSLSWKSYDEGQYKSDAKAFLFQLNKKYKLTQYQNKDCAVYHSSHFGPVFGDVDIELGRNEEFDEDESCRSGIYKIKDRTYSLPHNISNNKEDAKRYLAGSQYFKLIEIEVFKVSF